MQGWLCGTETSGGQKMITSPSLMTTNAISQRTFLAGLFSLALTFVGCRSSEEVRDASLPPPDTGMRPDSGMDAGRPTHFQIEPNYAGLPCHYPSDIDLYMGRMIGVCTTGGSQPGDRNHLFDFDPASGTRPISSTTRLDLPAAAGRSLNQFAAAPTGNRGVVTTNDGLYEVNLGSPTSNRFIAFPSGMTYGGGAVYAGNKLFVPVANLVGITTYNPGRVLVYDVDSGGVLQEGTVRSIATSRLNPTGVALRSPSTLVVLNSGDFSTSPQAAIDLIDAASEMVQRTIQLGSLTAQVSGEIALSSDGNTAVIGTSDNSGRVLFVNLDAGTITTRTLTGTRFHSSVVIDPVYGIVSVTDFNAGTVTVLDLPTQAILQSLMVASGEAGPSETYNGSLIQATPYGAVRIFPD